MQNLPPSTGRTGWTQQRGQSNVLTEPELSFVLEDGKDGILRTWEDEYDK